MQVHAVNKKSNVINSFNFFIFNIHLLWAEGWLRHRYVLLRVSFHYFFCYNNLWPNLFERHCYRVMIGLWIHCFYNLTTFLIGAFCDCDFVLSISFNTLWNKGLQSLWVAGHKSKIVRGKVRSIKDGNAFQKKNKNEKTCSFHWKHKLYYNKYSEHEPKAVKNFSYCQQRLH